MGTIETRLQRLEQAQRADDAPQWALAEFRPVEGADLWQDEATGRVGTKDDLTTLYPPYTIMVYLAEA